MKQKKLSFYELNVRYFRDLDGDGIGDLAGLANKFEYFNYLGIDVLILQDFLAVDSSLDKNKAFDQVAGEIGDVNQLAHVLSIANKYNIKVLIELPLHSITRHNPWFSAIENNLDDKFKDMINFVENKDDSMVNYAFSKKRQGYFIEDSETKEIPLDWNKKNVYFQFIEIIKYWHVVGVHGFVLKNFEFLGDQPQNIQETLISKNVLQILRKFYSDIKRLDSNLLIVGKSKLIDFKNASNYTRDNQKIFDYFLSQKFSTIGLHQKYKGDIVGKTKWWKIIRSLRQYGKSPNNIISFDSSFIGRSLSRWLNDQQYITESAKILILLSYMTKASSNIYFGNEIGMPNLNLQANDNFKDETLEKRKSLLRSQNISEKKFMEAQILQNKINAQAVMMWDESTNGGFSSSENIISKLNDRYSEINVKFQYINKDSVLNFTKKLISIIKQPFYQDFFARAKLSANQYQILGKTIRIKLKYQNQAIYLFINPSSSYSFYLPPRESKIKFSNYINKNNEQIKKWLEPFEAIIFLQNIDEENNKFARLERTKEIFTKKGKNNEANIQGILNRHEAQKKLEESQEIFEEVVPNNQIKSPKNAKWKKTSFSPTKEQLLKDQVANEERAKIIAKNQKKEVKKDDRLSKISKTSTIKKKTASLSQIKENAKIERDINRSYLDEKTKLTEDQLAKTTIIKEGANLDDLAGKPKSKK